MCDCFINQTVSWLAANVTISQWQNDNAYCFIPNEMFWLAGSQNICYPSIQRALHQYLNWLIHRQERRSWNPTKQIIENSKSEEVGENWKWLWVLNLLLITVCILALENTVCIFSVEHWLVWPLVSTVMIHPTWLTARRCQTPLDEVNTSLLFYSIKYFLDKLSVQDCQQRLPKVVLSSTDEPRVLKKCSEGSEIRGVQLRLTLSK